MNDPENELRLKIYIGMWIVFGVAFMLFGPIGLHFK